MQNDPKLNRFGRDDRRPRSSKSQDTRAFSDQMKSSDQ